MDGLECSEVFFSYAKRSNAIFRIDSFYYSKEFLGDENNIDAINTISFKELNADIKSFGAYSLNNDVEYIDEGVPFIRGVNIKNGRVNFSNMIYISESSHRLLWKSEVTPSTILLSMSGTIGDVALARDNWDYPINSNQDIAKIILNQNYNSYLACAFLLSKYGQNFMLREARGSVQQHVYLSQIETLKLPIFSYDFVEVIERLMLDSDNDYDLSEKKYIESTDMLLSSLNLKDFTIPEQSASVKNLSESFGSSGRLDAEYYQPIYSEYTKKLNATDTVGTICSLNDRNFIPSEKTEYKYIELANVGETGNISDIELIVGKDLPSRARRQVKQGQVIIASIEGSLQRCALITSEYHNALCSTGFYIVDSDSINAETLLVLFKSAPIQVLLKQRCSGTILTAINKEDFLTIPLPHIENNVQKDISQKVKQSFALRRKSEQLLENAKHAVEIAIEQGEEKAMEWLQDKVVM